MNFARHEIGSHYALELVHDEVHGVDLSLAVQIDHLVRDLTGLFDVGLLDDPDVLAAQRIISAPEIIASFTPDGFNPQPGAISLIDKALRHAQQIRIER